jgi:hypothetical protein
MVAIIVGLAPVESGCFRLWAMVLYQGGRRMTHAAKEAPDFTPQKTAITGLLSALNWEHPREKTRDSIQWTLRMVVYPREVDGFMEVVRSDPYHTLHEDIEPIGAEISALCGGWGRNIAFKVLSYA